MSLTETGPLTFVLGLAVRGTLIIGLVAAVLWLLRVRRATSALRVWALATAGVLVLPVGILAVPHWEVSLPEVPAIASPPALREMPLPVALPPESPRRVVVLPRLESTRVNSSSRSAPDGEAGWASVGLLFGCAYLLGIGLSVARLAVGIVRWQRLRRLSVSISEDIDAQVRPVACSLGLGSLPLMLEGPVSVPCVVGFVTPSVVLPRSWRNWDEATAVSVLTHELSHVARRDVLVRGMAEAYRVLFWFNPAAWWLHARIVALTEEASDDAVLERGADPAAYAATLLCFATRSSVTADVVAMASGRRIERRLMRVSAWTPASQTGVGLRGPLSGFAAAAVLICVAGAAPRAAEPLRLPWPAAPHASASPVPTLRPDARLELVETPAPQATAEKESLRISERHAASLTVPFGIRRLSLGDESVASVTALAGRELLVRAGRPGETTLQVWGDAGSRTSYRIEVEPEAAAHTVSGGAQQGTPVFTLLLFDLSSLRNDETALAVQVAKSIVIRDLTRASVGLGPLHLFAVAEAGAVTARGPSPLLLQDFSLSIPDVAAGIDRVAAMAAADGTRSARFREDLRSQCEDLSRQATRSSEILHGMWGTQFLRLTGMENPTAAAADIVVFNTSVSHGELAAFDPERLGAPCAALQPSVALEWMDEAAMKQLRTETQPYLTDYVAYRTALANPWRPIAMQVENLANGPVRVAATNPAFDNGYASLTVLNQAAKVIRSLTLEAKVTADGATRVFTRVGPAALFAPGEHADIESAVIDPIDFGVLSRTGGTAVVRVVAVEFADGTKWTADGSSGG